MAFYLGPLSLQCDLTSWELILSFPLDRVLPLKSCFIGGLRTSSIKGFRVWGLGFRVRGFGVWDCYLRPSSFGSYHVRVAGRQSRAIPKGVTHNLEKVKIPNYYFLLVTVALDTPHTYILYIDLQINRDSTSYSMFFSSGSTIPRSMHSPRKYGLCPETYESACTGV